VSAPSVGLFSTVWRRLGGVGVLLGMLTTAALAIDARYAKTADVQELKALVRDFKVEARINVLENERNLLRSEMRALNSVSKRTPLEDQRLATAAEKLRDVEEDIRVKRTKQAEKGDRD